MTVTRQQHLEERVEELQDRVNRDARSLQQLTRNVDRQLSTTTRDSIVSVVLRLHDSRRELDTVRTELRLRSA